MYKPLLASALALLATSSQAQTIVFSTDFDSGLPAQIVPGTALLEGVQGYSGYGPVTAPFGGDFLRSATANTVTLTLNGLAPHSTISIDFLFAAIDSLDGTGSFPSGDYFKVTLDDTPIFRESFANATPDQVQSYVPPAGVELARHVDLGFSGPGGFYTDSAYRLGADPIFQNMAHSGATAVFTFVIEGLGAQDLNDESWAMDQLRVSTDGNTAPVPEPQTWALMRAGLGVLGALARRRSANPR